MKGSYCLIISLKKNSRIKVGSLYNSLNLNKGFYVYIGSAMNSLIPRIRRHLSDNKKLHWHIDYLLKSRNSAIREVLFTDSEKRIECDLAQLISSNGEEIPKFGCTDCNCNSHLIYFKLKKDAMKSVEEAYNTLNISYMNLDDFEKIVDKENR